MIEDNAESGAPLLVKKPYNKISEGRRAHLSLVSLKLETKSGKYEVQVVISGDNRNSKLFE